jgi:hypothetical protein
MVPPRQALMTSAKAATSCWLAMLAACWHTHTVSTLQEQCLRFQYTGSRSVAQPFMKPQRLSVTSALVARTRRWWLCWPPRGRPQRCPAEARSGCALRQDRLSSSSNRIDALQLARAVHMP